MIRLPEVRYNVQDAKVFPGLTVLPLYKQKEPEGKAVEKLLGEAIQEGTLRVLETDGGSVPRLNIEVETDTPVFGLKGTLLIGGGQDRQLLHSCIVNKGSFEIPVQCVQHGRWNPSQNRNFQSGEDTTSSSLRYHTQTQEQVWQKIRNYEGITQTSSGTETFSCTRTLTLGSEKQREETKRMYAVNPDPVADQIRDRAQKMLQALKSPTTGQIGILAIQLDPFFEKDSKEFPVNYLLETTGDESLWAKVHSKVLESLIYDAAVMDIDNNFAIDMEKEEVATVEKFFHDLVEGSWQEEKSIGIESRWGLQNNADMMGEAILLEDESLEQKMVHLLARTTLMKSAT